MHSPAGIDVVVVDVEVLVTLLEVVVVVMLLVDVVVEGAAQAQSKFGNSTQS